MSTLTEIEDLRLYIVERLQLVDPTLDTSTGSELDTKFIQPLLERLGPDPYNTNIRQFILSRLNTEFPDLVLQDGEPIDDYLIKPLQILLEPYRRQIRQISINQSFDNPSLLNEREGDNLGTNFFTRRRLGAFSVGVARLYYSAPQYALISPSNPVFDGGGLRFFPVENQAISAENMLFNLEDGLYFFDVVVRSENQGTEYNIPKTTLVGIEDADSVVKVTNKADFSEGDDKENTEEFVERTENSLTEKSLVTWKGITARLTDVFENIRLIQVIGLNDPEMKRDIIKGSSQSQAYALFTADTPAVAGDSTPQITLNTSGSGFINDGNPSHDDFIDTGVQVGDVVTWVDGATQAMSEYEVTDVVDGDNIYVTPNITDDLSQNLFMIRKAVGKITISDIPGGILEPNTQAGTIEINDGEIHIGGALDVYIRAGQPQTRDTTLEGILDGSPLHFGVDLESFGSIAETQKVQLTRTHDTGCVIVGTDKFGDALSDFDEILVLSNDRFTGVENWLPSEEDVGRYVQLLEGNTANDRGIFEISEVKGMEYYQPDGDTWWYRVTRVKLDLSKDHESGATSVTLTPDAGNPAFNVDLKLLDGISQKFRVRDRDGSTEVIAEDSPNPGEPEISGGIDYVRLGVSIGDSVVIETGDDAGIYSVRRILTWLASNDTVILDRELNNSVKPLGTGARDGLRYRVADELNVDLIAPRTTKIPLGSIFAGNDLNTTAGSELVSVTGDTNFLLAGVEAGDTLEVLEGDNAGKYKFVSVQGTTAELNAPMANVGFLQSFSVYRAFTGISLPMVRVEDVELLDSNSQPTGVKIPYGDYVDGRIQSSLANREEGNVVERYTGFLQNNGPGIYDLYDPNVNFVTESVEEGYRLNIRSTSSSGYYTIIAVGTGDSLLSDSHVRVAHVDDGGTEFRTVASQVHYSIGQPSTGWLRLYFLEPTSVEINTGMLGGRLYSAINENHTFRFSDVQGYSILPPGGDDEDLPRDLKVSRVRADGGDFQTILELTDPTNPGVYELEVQEGDVVEAHQQIHPKFIKRLAGIFTWNSTTTVSAGVDPSDLFEGNWIQMVGDSNWFEVTNIVGTTITIANPSGLVIPAGAGKQTDAIGSLKERGVFGKPAGLRTLAGSNLVSVPGNSLIDFAAMDITFPLAGQTLRIDTGADAGEYIIESVVDSKSLRLSTVMTATTDPILSREAATTRDAELTGSGSKSNLQDLTDGSSLTFGAQVDHRITIFESMRPDLDGTYKISDDLPASADTVEIDASFNHPDYDNGDHPPLDPFSLGMFTWIRTEAENLIEQEFRIYRDVPVELTVEQVATKRPDTDHNGNGAIRRAEITTLNTLVDLQTGYTIGGLKGDAIEIISGQAAGLYWLNADTSGQTATIFSNPSFPATIDNVPYRLWAGLHGSRRMMTVGVKDSFNGKLEPGDFIPYRLRRPSVARISSTEMQDNFDGTLYYFDIQIESEGAGDELNFAEGARLVVSSGLSADGYTYSVANNRLTFSPFEEVQLNFDRRFLPVGNSDRPDNLSEVSGRNLRVSYETSTPVRLANDLLRSDAERPVCANPIARHFLPSYIFFSVQYSGGLSEEEIGAELEDYINSLGGEQEIEVSDLEAFLTRRGATYIRHPLQLVSVTHDVDRNLVVDRSENKLGGLNSVSFNGTGRIACFFTTLGETLILEKQS